MAVAVQPCDHGKLPMDCAICRRAMMEAYAPRKVEIDPDNDQVLVDGEPIARRIDPGAPQFGPMKVRAGRLKRSTTCGHCGEIGHRRDKCPRKQ